MKYTATYKSSPTVIKSLLEAYRNLIKCDGYYAMYGGGGTGVVSQSSTGGSWGDYSCTLVSGSFDSLDQIADKLTVKDIAGKRIGWTTSAGNSAHFTIDDTILIELSGRRHGIPDFLQDTFKDLAPIKVVNYDSFRTDQPPWDKGLTPSNDPSALVQFALDANNDNGDLPDWINIDIIHAVRQAGYPDVALSLTKRI